MVCKRGRISADKRRKPVRTVASRKTSGVAMREESQGRTLKKNRAASMRGLPNQRRARKERPK